jgi:hypothetical protein
MMRRLLLAALLTAVLPAALHASGRAMLGAGGELYRVHSGTFKTLFAAAPVEQAGNAVLALDIVRDGNTQRLLVPGTEGPEVEQSPALTVDHATNRVFLVWQGQQFIHSVLNLISYSASGFGEVFEFAGDSFSIKSNPQLATTLDSYQVLDAANQPVAAHRTILHLAWYDDGASGERVLYTPLVIVGEVLRANRIFDLQELAGDDAAAGAANPSAPSALLQKPQVRSGRDGQSVVVSFVVPATGELAALELRSVTGELVSFADKARAQVIETGHSQPGLSRAALAEKARAQVIETGRRLMRRELADFLAKTFLDTVGASPPEESLEHVAEKARAQVIETGVGLRRGVADRAKAQVIEIVGSAEHESTSHLLDLRKAARRDLPGLPDRAMQVFLSQKGDDAALAWTVDNTVSYRESTADGGWSEVRILTLGPTLSSDDAYALVEQRLAGR